MILLVAVLALASPSLDGRTLHPGKTCFTMSRGSGEAMKPFGKMSRIVTRRQHDGVDALEIATHQQITNARGTFNMDDVYLVRRSDLRPISYRNLLNGKKMVELSYGPTRITGTKDDKGQAVTIDQPLEGPVWEIGIWGSLVGALPLKKAGSYQIPYFHYAQGLGEAAIKVVGEQMIETPKGRQRAWVVDGNMNPQLSARYFISKKDRQELGYYASGITQILSDSCPTPV